MFVVIFRARVAQLDEAYAVTANALRNMALRDHACLEFHAVTEGEEEVALSYWSDL